MNNTIMNAENVSKLVAIISKYDVFAEFIDDYEQYGAAMEQNDMVAADFVATARAMGFTVSDESLDSLIERMAKRMPAEDAIKEYLTAQNTNNIKEEKKMSKNDYTMGGTIEATNWAEFKAVCKEHGINCGTKTFTVLSEELSAILSAKTTPAEFVVHKSMSEAIVRRILIGGKDRNGKQHAAAMFKASKSKDPEVNGKWMVTMAKLYAIVADVYKLEGKTEANDAFIKQVINYLCKNGWLRFKKYDTGAISFFPTVKMQGYFAQ